MYNSTSGSLGYQGGGSIDTLLSRTTTPSFSLADPVSEAYICEGCQKLLSRMYGKEDPKISVSRPQEQCMEKEKYGVLSYHLSQSYIPLASGTTAYNLNKGDNAASYQNLSRTYEFAPTVFLKQIRPQTPFIENTNQILELAGEAFLHLTGKQLPKDIDITICTKDELKERHGRFGKWGDGIQGFAINGNSSKQIFVKQDHLDALMMVLGHEIGHVFTPSLSNKHDEEAKAFSFAEAWAICIKKHNIGNLASCIKEEGEWLPAQNGLHDVAFFFVKNLIKKGLEPMRVHWDLAKGYRSVFNIYQ